MGTTLTQRSWLRRQIAWPTEHGAWVFLLSPLVIGLVAGAGQAAPGRGLPVLWLVIAALAAFLLRQPVSMAVKILGGRRPAEDWPATRFWIGVYGLLGLGAVLGLWQAGLGWLLVLALPALPVFVWHLVLISRRAERRQVGVELVGSGVLALAAPAAYWVMRGSADPLGWWLWLLTWLQSAASIVYAYLRLEQRGLRAWPSVPERLRMGWRALAYAGFNTLFVAALAARGTLPALLVLPYALQLAEGVWGTLRPAVGVKPTRIGVRQLIVSSLFTVAFCLAWAWSG